MSDLPAGWESCLLDEINDPTRPICYGILMPGPDLPGGVPYVKVRNIRDEKVLVDDVHRTSVEIESKFARSRLRTGDVLVSIRGTYGRTALVPSELDGGNITQDTARVAPVGANGEYIRLFMQSPVAQSYFKAVARGVAVKGVNIGDLRELPVPLAPAPEQERIVAAVEAAFSKLDAGESGLRLVRKRLRRIRDAILAAAVNGLLIPQDPAHIPANKVLADLGVAPLDHDEHLDVPEGWAWATVETVGSVDLGRQRHPDWHSGPNMKPYLRVANVFEDRIDASDVKEMHFEPAVFERFKVRPGDVLLNEGQTPALLGRPAIYRGEPADVAFTNSILRFRAGPAVLAEWSLLVFRHYMRSGRFTREARITTNIAHLSASRLKPIEFPVPPLDEQIRIVAEAERQLSFVEACERAVDAGLRRSLALRRSILKAAFEGRLVAQDPTEEPASMVLERTRAERAATPKRTSRRARGKS